MRVATRPITFIEEGRVIIDGIEYKPQNLPKADAYSLLADVRAVLQEDYDKLNKMKSSKATGLFRAIYLLDEYISEHFS